MNPKVDTYPQNYLRFLFRQSGAGSSATRLRNARLVGRCYVHGFVDGEAMSEIRTKLNNAARDKVSDEENRNLVLA
jgi:hypothetical protein